jgi:hypothetical protein
VEPKERVGKYRGPMNDSWPRLRSPSFSAYDSPGPLRPEIQTIASVRKSIVNPVAVNHALTVMLIRATSSPKVGRSSEGPLAAISVDPD